MIIGVIDSGIGGLAALARISEALGKNHYIYFSDNLFAPYGNLNRETVEARVKCIARKLVARGAALILILCNTAGTVCGAKLKRELTVPVVYISPVLVEKGEGGAVVATPLTVSSIDNKTGLDTIAADGLSAIVERSAPDFAEAEEEITRLLKGRSYRYLILGCTHYIYLRDAVRKALPRAVIYDGTSAVKAECRRLFPKRERAERELGSIEICFSGADEFNKYLAVIKRCFYGKKGTVFRGSI